MTCLFVFCALTVFDKDGSISYVGSVPGYCLSLHLFGNYSESTDKVTKHHGIIFVLFIFLKE